MIINYKGAKLHRGQMDIVSKVIKSSALYTTICAPRQYGKSFLIEQLILYYAINNNNTNTLYTAPSYNLSKKVFNEIVKAIRTSNIIKKIDNMNYQLELINGSTISFKSIQLPDNLRGLSVDYMFLDEAALYKDDIFNEILRPMLTVRGKKCFLLSTPKGKNYFYSLFQMADINKRYEAYKGSSIDNPYANKEEIDDARKVLPENIFKQEYEAEFIDDSGTVFSNIRDNITHSRKNSNTYYAGLDLAKQRDYTVLTILNEYGEIVEIYRNNKTDWNIMVDDIVKLLNKYKPRSTMVEVNNIGDVIFDMIRKKYSNIEAFTTTSDTKQQIIEHLILAFNDKTIKLLDDKDLINELEMFSFSYNKKTRRIKYEATSGFNDDMVMSLAICNWAKYKGSRKGEYIIY